MYFVGTQAAATNLIKSLGTTCTFTRAGLNLFKSPVVFIKDSKTVARKNGLSDGIRPIRVSSMIVGNVVAYVSGNVKVPPLPEDNVTNGKGRSYNITEVEAIKPADVVLAYRISME